MTPSDWLEVGEIAGLIVGVWFALLGWKLLPLARTHPPTRPEKF
jgi:hypothetical protein